MIAPSVAPLPVLGSTATSDTAILERLIATNNLGAVCRYDTWCYDGQRYPDARSALVAFMGATERVAGNTLEARPVADAPRPALGELARRVMDGTVEPDGVLRLTVNIAVGMRELADWPPQCVAAFMAGVAQCLGAEAHAKEARNGTA